MPPIYAATTRARSSSSARRRKTGVTKPQPVCPIRVTGFSPIGSVIQVSYDQPVSVVGVPAYTINVAGVTPVSVVQTASNIIEITYSGSVAAATTLDVGFNDPAIRNNNGGYVIGTSYVLA